jgi:hypothetical protein
MNNEKTVAKEEAHVSPSEADKDFVLETCADLTEAGYGFSTSSPTRCNISI